MGLVNFTQIQDGTSADANDVNPALSTIYDEFNGNIEAANIANSAITTAKIADGAVTNAKLSTTTGELGGAWDTWTPTFTNLSEGTGGTITAKYTQIGKTVNFYLRVNFGTSGVSVGSVLFTLPKPFASTFNDANVNINGMGSAHDGSGSTGVLVGRYWDSNTVRLLVMTANTTYVDITSMSATAPHTWGTGDMLAFTGTYETS